MLNANKTKHIYKTIIINTKNKVSVDVSSPDDGGNWKLYSIIVKSNRIYYTWEKQEIANTFSSSEEAFQKSLDMVKSASAYASVEIKDKEVELGGTD